LGPKSFASKIILDSRNFFAQNNIWHKNLSGKKELCEKIFGVKQKFWSQPNLGRKNWVNFFFKNGLSGGTKL